MTGTLTNGRHRRDGAAGFVHAVMFHCGGDDFLAGALPYVRDGLAAEESTVVALTPDLVDAVRDALGQDAAPVHFVDVTQIGRNPARLVPGLRQIVDHHGRGTPFRVLGSAVWSGRTEAELAACVQHEATNNLAFDDVDMSILCPYDTTGLDDDTLTTADAVHPAVLEDGKIVPNPAFGDPIKIFEAASGPLLEPDVLGEALVFSAPHGPRTVRAAVARHAERAGLRLERVVDLCAAVHEVALNTMVHTDAPGILSLWVEDDAVVCEIQDRGWISDPLAGRRPPAPHEGEGYGLYRTHQLCDLVRIHSSPDTGTTVRMSMSLHV